jgi:prostaglandin-H2 D-isomerase / glutathione transferase
MKGIPFSFQRAFLVMIFFTSWGFLNSSNAFTVSASATTAGAVTTPESCAAMPHELVYFDTPGRAESIRILLHAAGIEFSDTRIPFSDWSTLKPTTPLGSVPILNINGTPHVQSIALVRYAAKLAGFYPQDLLEALVVDEVMDSINELISKAPRSQDKEELKKLRQDYQATTMTQYASFLENVITRNGSLLVVGQTVTVADLSVRALVQAVATGSWDYVDAGFFNAYPGILASTKAAEENDKVVAYYASQKK